VNPRPRRVGANGVGAERTEIRDEHFDGVLMVIIHDEDVEAVQTARRQGAHVGGAKSNAPNATLGSPHVRRRLASDARGPDRPRMGSGRRGNQPTPYVTVTEQ
jgi:hypothetical protein